MQVSANEDARCAIIGAAGSVFCSGHDLAELRNAQDTANQGPTAEAIFEKCSHVMQLIQVAHSSCVIAMNVFFKKVL
jgi:enoyl-CoA hydratase/carnithine racemase